LEERESRQFVGKGSDMDETWHEEGRQFDAAAWVILAVVFGFGLIIGIVASILLLA